MEASDFVGRPESPNAPTAATLPEIEHRLIDCGEVRLDCALAGSVEKPLVVLLHGFPESWYSWRHQIAGLAPDYWVAAPSLRGYGRSDRPAAVAAYRIDRLAADVAGLIRALGREQAYVVAHDWGGGVAWAFAIDYPAACAKLAVLNCPHPAVFERALRTNPRQLLRSWYMFFFQLPWLPEWIIRRNDFALVRRAFRATVGRKGEEVFSDADLDELTLALAPPGALRAAVNYYRAAFRHRKAVARYASAPPIACPTLLIWGENDVALGKELTLDMEPLFRGAFSVKYIPDCSHWVQQEAPALVNQYLREFLA
jgi:pimeloyl-ACP methyl ester carboxylesterase